MKPSSTTGTRRAAPARTTPTSPAISKPPTAARTPRASPGSGRLTASARRTASTFPTQTSSATPVPRPVTIAGSAPVSAAVSALAAVVLPIPISPVPTQSGADASTSAAPSAIARSGLFAGHRGPLRDAAGARPDARVRGLRRGRPAAPRRRGSRRPPAPRRGERARSRAAPPCAKFSTICAVTAWGYALTPSVATPWSPASVKITGASIMRQGIPGDHDHPDGELLQPPQAPPRLRQAVEPVAGRLSQPLVRHDDGGDEAIEGDHARRPPSGRPRGIAAPSRPAGNRRPSARPRRRRAPRPG